MAQPLTSARFSQSPATLHRGRQVSGAYDLVALGSPGVTISMPNLAWTPDRHRTARHRTPGLKRSTNPSLQARSSVLPKADQSNAPKVQTANQRHKIKLAPAPVHVQLLHTKEGEVVVPKADNVHHLKKHGPHSAHASARPRHHYHGNRNLHQQKSHVKVHVETEHLNKHGSHPSIGGHHVTSTIHEDSTPMRHHLKHANHRSKHHQKSTGRALAGKRFQHQHKKTGYRTQSHQEADKGQRAKSDSRKKWADKYDELWSLLEGHSKRADPSALPASDDEEHRLPLKVKKRKKATHKHDKKMIFASRALRHGKHRLWQRLFKVLLLATLSPIY
uniref:Uncharacterized protein n=1 Tax=Branchiostoma floridae TaxID=7739 RepID=C3ZLY8_BRAFL|eukprot:XP_002590458.1 hypothetical protein BRAFLDRAFT_86326 [Branchiostoma floridae]